VNAIAQTKRCYVCCFDKNNETGTNLGGACVCADRARAKVSPIIDSPSDQPWAEFCGQLEQPAFLMPVTGFGDLE
jgi:hypothetical protein